jgi:hypothetical protein
LYLTPSLAVFQSYRGVIIFITYIIKNKRQETICSDIIYANLQSNVSFPWDMEFVMVLSPYFTAKNYLISFSKNGVLT